MIKYYCDCCNDEIKNICDIIELSIKFKRIDEININKFICRKCLNKIKVAVFK